jgi:Ricin-type beta-trefoil lectin domain
VAALVAVVTFMIVAVGTLTIGSGVANAIPTGGPTPPAPHPSQGNCLKNAGTSITSSVATVPVGGIVTIRWSVTANCPNPPIITIDGPGFEPIFHQRTSGSATLTAPATSGVLSWVLNLIPPTGDNSPPASDSVSVNVVARPLAVAPDAPVVGFGGKCIDAPGGNTVDGTTMQLWTCNGTPAQQYTFANDGSVRIMGKCLDVFFAGTTNGTPVVIATCNGTVAQQWRHTTANQLINPHSNACLDATNVSSADGTLLQIWACTGGANQQWSLTPARDASATTLIPLAGDVNFTLPEGNKTIVSTTLTLRAGETRRVLGRVDAVSTSFGEVEYAAGVQCTDAAGNPAGDYSSAVAAENHEGRTLGLGGPLRHVVLYPSLLFKAPAAGTYTCRLVAETGDPGNYYLTAVARDPQGNSTTWLKVSVTDEAGSHLWKDKFCDSAGKDDNCVYLPTLPADAKKATDTTPAVPAHGLLLSTELFADHTDGIELWTAASDAAYADVSATVKLTSCYTGTGSCSDQNENGADEAVVVSHLEFNQLNTAGAVCKVNRSNDLTSTITNNAHHYSIYMGLTRVPVSPDCGTNQFQIKVHLQYVSGNPVKIDGFWDPDLNDYAFATNSVYGTLPPDLTS